MRRTHFCIDSDDEIEQQSTRTQPHSLHESTIAPVNVRKSRFNIDSDDEDDVRAVLDPTASKRTRYESANTYEKPTTQNLSSSSSGTLAAEISSTSMVAADHTTTTQVLKLTAIDMDDSVRNELRSAIQQPVHVSALLYAAANRPTSHSVFSRPWIYIYNYELLRPHNTSYVGKWMWFVSPEHVDDAFVAIAAALDTCHLGSTVKTAPLSSSDSVVPIIIYTDDYRDQTDVLRVGLAVQSLLLKPKTLSYKPDVFTLNEEGIHGNNTLKYKTIYQLKPEARELTLVDHGKALTCALRMSLEI